MTALGVRPPRTTSEPTPTLELELAACDDDDGKVGSSFPLVGSGCAHSAVLAGGALGGLYGTSWDFWSKHHRFAFKWPGAKPSRRNKTAALPRPARAPPLSPSTRGVLRGKPGAIAQSKFASLSSSLEAESSPPLEAVLGEVNSSSVPVSSFSETVVTSDSELDVNIDSSELSEES